MTTEYFELRKLYLRTSTTKENHSSSSLQHKFLDQTIKKHLLHQDHTNQQSINKCFPTALDYKMAAACTPKIHNQKKGSSRSSLKGKHSRKNIDGWRKKEQAAAAVAETNNNNQLFQHAIVGLLCTVA